MKKAGSSSSKSKTRRTSKSTPRRTDDKVDTVVANSGTEAALLADLVVGHQPAPGLSPQDSALFRAFQSNLLSLISHELRTPLMVILNSLTVLDERQDAEKNLGGEDVLGSGELVRIARQNAHRLNRTLATLLDLAAIESRTFHAKLRELELARMVHNRLEMQRSLFRDQELNVSDLNDSEVTALGDSQKLARALDLIFEVVATRAEKGSRIEVRISSSPSPKISARFRLAAGGERPWELAWTHGRAGFEAGLATGSSPFSGSFAGVMQAEQAFLTRTEEGLGSELLLVHEILRQHQGELLQKTDGRQVELQLRLPALSSDGAIQAVLSSRTYELSTEPTAVALLLVGVPKNEKVEDFCSRLKGKLLRASDGAYPLPERNLVAVILDDYRKDDLPKVLRRIEKSLGVELEAGLAHCPDDVADPRQLLDEAARRIRL